MCVWRCDVRAKVKDERVYKLEGNPFHPHSRGMLCPRSQAGIATAYDPDRLKYPLIRSGPRGSGKWRRLSWNEALDYVAAQMLAIKNQYGAEAMIFSTTHNLVQTQFENMLHAYGTPNYGTQRSLCYNAMITANLLTFGLEEPERDYSQTQYIIYTGRNMLDCVSNSESQDTVSAIARGQGGRAGAALHEDRGQSNRVAAHQARHRPGIPPGAHSGHYRARAVRRRFRQPVHRRL